MLNENVSLEGFQDIPQEIPIGLGFHEFTNDTNFAQGDYQQQSQQPAHGLQQIAQFQEPMRFHSGPGFAVSQPQQPHFGNPYMVPPGMMQTIPQFQQPHLTIPRPMASQMPVVLLVARSTHVSKFHKKQSKIPTQADLELRLLINNVDAITLKELSFNLSKLELQGFPTKKAKSNSKASVATKIDITETVDMTKFNTILSCLPKTKKIQLFGYAWLKKSCKISQDFRVPREKIYSKYASSCATHDVPAVSAALFGKLLRAIFPFITVYRGGFRAGNKYHYRGIQLLDDDGPNSEESSPLRSVIEDSLIASSTHSPFYSSTQMSPASTDCTSYGDQHFEIMQSGSMPRTSVNYFEDLEVKFVPNLLEELENFGSGEAGRFVLTVPPITQYLPNDMAADGTLELLFQLYQAHCNDVFESLRYMKLKTLQKALTSFVQSLTEPILKLFVNEHIMAWVQKSDVVMYQIIAKMLGKLTLQEVPIHVLDQLSQVATVYPKLLSESLTTLPPHCCKIKLAPARRFCSLVSKIVEISILRTTASDLIVLLNATLLNAWVNNVKGKEIVSNLQPFSERNRPILVNLLQEDIPRLLRNKESTLSWLKCFSRLSLQSTGTPAGIFLLLLNSILDLAIMAVFSKNESNFKSWWCIKSWISEWLSWYSDMGGFLTSFDQTSASKLENKGGQTLAVLNTEESDGQDKKNTVDLLDGDFGLFDETELLSFLS